MLLVKWGHKDRVAMGLSTVLPERDEYDLRFLLLYCA